MTRFKNMKISRKLLIGFSLIALIAAIIGIVGVLNIKKVDDNGAIMYTRMTVPLSVVSEMSSDFQKVRVATRDIILANTADEISQDEAKIIALRKTITENADKFGATIVHQDVKAAFQDFENTRNAYTPFLEKLITLAKENKDDEAIALLKGDMAKAANNEMAAIEKLIELKVRDADAKYDENDLIATESIVAVIVLLVVAIGAAVVLGLYISKIISKPIRNLVAVSNRLAQGDIDIDIENKTSDEIGELLRSYEQMVHSIKDQESAISQIAAGDLTVDFHVRSDKDVLGYKLNELLDKNNEILSSINVAAEQVTMGARQIANSSISLAQGATEQASAIEELSATIDDIATKTKTNADNSNKANEFTTTAKTNALDGDASMKGMLKSMDEINESSRNISRIIKVIDDIAFQTNILALNAAVEAARAGQNGRGFAVVAEEVRNLAAKSANAARETTSMIEDSMKKVTEGTKAANKTAGALNKIVSDISVVSSLIDEISVLSNDQAESINQINQSITQLTQVVQSNSATSEESAAASEELSSQAEMLKQQVDSFKLRDISQSYLAEDAVSPLRLLPIPKKKIV